MKHTIFNANIFAIIVYYLRALLLILLASSIMIRSRTFLKRCIRRFWGGLSILFYIFISPRTNIFTQGLYSIVHTYKTSRLALTSHMCKNPDNLKIINEKIITDINLEALSKLPEDTLGYSLYAHLVKNKIKLFKEDKKPPNDHTYIINRLGILHDISHVLINADTTFFGETRLIGFYLAQFPHYHGPLINIACAFIRMCLYEQSKIYPLLRELIKGFYCGMQAKNIFAADYNLLWEEPMELIRDGLYIKLSEDSNLSHLLGKVTG